MTVEERESRFKAVVPAAVIALTDVINCYTEVSTFDGETAPEEAMKAVDQLEMVVLGIIQVGGDLCGTPVGQLMPGVIALARRALQNAFEAAPGGLIGGK